MCVLLALWGLVILALGYPGNDDKYITYFVSDALVRGQGLINLNGELVEQSSTLLFTGLLAGISAISGLRVIDIGYFTSLGLYLLSAVPLVLLLRRCQLASWHAVILLMAPPVLYWALTGMENSAYLLFALLTVLFLDNARQAVRLRDLLALLVLGALLALTRPEGVVVVIAAAVLFILLTGTLRAPLLGVLALCAGSLLALAARMLAGLSLFPLPVHSKTAIAPAQALSDGVGYLLHLAQEFPAFALPMLVLGGLIALLTLGDILRRRQWLQLGTRPVLAAAIAILAATTAFPLAAGGDWMPFGRFLTVPCVLVPLVALLLTPARLRAVFATVLLLACLSGVQLILQFPNAGAPFFGRYAAQAQHFSPSWLDERNPIHSRDIHIIDALLEEIEKYPAGELTIASIQMGMVPYHVAASSRKPVRFFDFRGLATRDVHECAAVQEPFLYDPYASLQALQDCHGRPFDLVFDLVRPGRVEAVVASGCRILRELDLQFTVDWRHSTYRPRAFIADCRPAQP